MNENVTPAVLGKTLRSAGTDLPVDLSVDLYGCNELEAVCNTESGGTESHYSNTNQVENVWISNRIE